MQYVPISFKSDYSLMKSLLKIKDIVDYAKSRGSEYVGVLDENPYGIMDFYDKCEKNGLKGIFGVIVKIGDNKIYLYIKNFEGYLNIIKINELMNENKLSLNDLMKYNAGLICVLPYENYNMYNRFKVVFDTYLGYRSRAELKNAELISKKVLFLNEVMYLKKEDSKLLSILYKIAGTTYERGEHFILEATEEDVRRIDEFQKEIDLKFEFKDRYIPKFCKTKEESSKLLKTLAVKGLSRRLNGNVPNEYKERLKYELNVIESMGFVDYFLIVYDYVKYAKQNDIMVSPRGSAAGSLVSYTLGITDVDPMEYDLLFERFLNPERITMPDIDMDFEDVKRNDVINYVRSKYGEKQVSLIVAYGTMGSRQVVRDVGKVFEIDQKIVDMLSKKLDAKKTLKDNLKDESLVQFVKENNLEMMYKISIRLEGLKKHTTIHAAGVVISDTPLLEIIPTFKTSDGILTGYTMEYLEKIGLLKMDFLAVRNLTTIHNTVRLVEKKNPNFKLKDIPLDDAKTYNQIFKTANTDNVFQFETPGMKNFIKKLEPENFDDLAAATALFRPGPMQNIDEYIARRKGKRSVTYLHPDLEPILKSTYGIIVYQEQIMQILSKMSGYSYAEADLIRRAMSKKKKEVMEGERIRFIEKSVARGYDEKVASEVYALIVKFADYGFNKSHSVAYALIGYWMAYLKANYTELFHLNTLNMNMGSETKVKDVIEDAKNKGFRIIKPDINMSSYEYVSREGTIILPLTSIKNVSSLQSKVIVDNHPFEDYFDFFKKVYGNVVNKNLVETLIKAGAMDSFNESKNTLLANIDAAITYIELVKSLDESLVMKPELVISTEPDVEYSEVDIFGFYVSGHPSCKYGGIDIVKIKNLENFIDKRVNVVVLVDKVKVINTKKGEKMAFVSINDDTKSCSLVVFPKQFHMVEDLDLEGINKIRCNVAKRNDEIQLIFENIQAIEKDSSI